MRLHAQLLHEAAEEITGALQRVTVPHFFAKGIALHGQFYRPGDRELADIDLYVHPAGRSLALPVLRELGYGELPPREQSGPASHRPGTVLLRAARTEVESVTVDVHWGLEPVERLLPRADTPIPEPVWGEIGLVGTLPVPTPGHHAALIVHHLVHHDLLHARGLLDLALLWGHVPDGGASLAATARALHVTRALAAVGAALRRDLALASLPAVGSAPDDRRGRRLGALLVLDRWLAMAGAASYREHAEITPARVARRLLLLDRPASAVPLLADAVLPPRAHLRWRWPEAGSDLEAWWRHLRSALGKLRGRA
jgi:hypothetical protein